MSSPQSKRARQGVQLVKSYQATFGDKTGESVLLDLMKNHNVFDSTFSGDVNESLIKEGERRVVLRILKLMKANPNELLERIRNYEKDVE